MLCSKLGDGVLTIMQISINFPFNYNHKLFYRVGLWIMRWKSSSISVLQIIIKILYTYIKNYFFFILQVVIPSGEGKFVGIVRLSQRMIKLKNVVYIDISEGLTFLPDQLHLDTKSAVRIGQELANSFLSNFNRWNWSSY